tara:strand:+ start:337 stop:600 length:264 start_codon:yes stop_codon:yes gene_type:complete
MRNNQVTYAWSRGNIASAKNLLTDGKELFSYQKKIGFTTSKGEKVVIDFMASSDSFVSQTTSCHVSLAKRSCDIVMHPLTEEFMNKG